MAYLQISKSGMRIVLCNLRSLLANSLAWWCEITTPHVKFNPRLPWYKQHSARGRLFFTRKLDFN